MLLIGLMLLGLGLRIWFVHVNQLAPQYSSTDDGDYYQRALRFATTGQYVDDFWFIRSPLHVLLFALLLRISILLGSIDGVYLIRVVQIGLGLITIPAGYDLARRLFNPQAGLIFAAILSVWFPLVELPAHLFSEPLFFCLLVVHLWLLVCWRDTDRWWMLACSGSMLGLTALARSPTLYSVAFVVLNLFVERRPTTDQRRPTTDQRPTSGRRRAIMSMVLRRVLIFTAACALTIAPWTIRNYMVYGRFIPIDTIGQVNLWLITGDHNRRGSEILLRMPQGERQDFAMRETRHLIETDLPRFWSRLWYGADRNFQLIWKPQFVIDFFDQVSFYARPLREFWILGIAGDLLWLAFVMCGLMALVAPLYRCEGAFRLIALGWVGYTILSIMILHAEPRYMLPIWLMLALYGSWTLSDIYGLARQLVEQRWRAVLALGLLAVFLYNCFSYRNYVRLIAGGTQREVHLAAGARDYRAGDDVGAEQEFRSALQAHPGFIETRVALALTLIRQGQHAEAHSLLSDDASQWLDMARGALAAAEGNMSRAATLLTEAEIRSSERIQPVALTWVRPAPTRYLEVGNGLDLGYIMGFSPGEQLITAEGARLSYRWLERDGRIILPLPEPLQGGSVVSLHLSAGRPEGTVLDVGFDEWRTETIQITGDGWRMYHLLVPEALHGRQKLRLELSGPTFIPAHRYPDNTDVRLVTIMMRSIQVR